MTKQLKIQEVPMITPSGKQLDDTEEIVLCPKNLTKVNIRKSCAKCKQGTINSKHVMCEYKQTVGDFNGN